METTGGITYEWDAEHRLVGIKAGDQRLEFAYDGNGHRISIHFVVNGVEVSSRRFVWCDNEMCEERSSTGTVVKRFFPQGVKIETGPMQGSYYYCRDHLGSVRELIDSVGVVRSRYQYEPYGRRVRVAGDLDTDFGFSNYFSLVGTDQDLSRFRVYDSGLGRWLSRDPLPNAELREGLNLYTYAHNDPINRTDYLGLKVWRCCRDVEVNPWIDRISKVFGYQHCFIETNDKEAGMGPADDGPLPAYPLGTDTKVNDHTGESQRSHCEEIWPIDEDCVNRELQIGMGTGPWSPWNNCNTFVDNIEDKCWKPPLY